MSHANILVVDDEPGIREQLGNILRDEGFNVRTAASGEEALAALANELYELVLLDILLPGVDGLQLLAQLRSSGETVPVVVISGHASAEMAAGAVRAGAFDFLEKPLALERVLVTVENAVRHGRLTRQIEVEREETEPSLTGISAAIVELRRQIMRAAPTDSRVLICGPNGTGKEVVARLLHRHSRRAENPFVAINCAAIPSELIESELFGHLKGAFTGAGESRRGKLDLADGGTLFLDEIGDMSLLTQAKVLRVLQEARFTRLGGGQEVSVDVRVVAATNKDLEAEIAAGRFRQDLFFRLNVIQLRVPPLAERREDVPLLFEEFSRQLARRTGLPEKRLDAGARQALIAYDWPGNVREVRNLVERTLIMVPGAEIGEADLGLRRTSPEAFWDEASLPLKEARDRFERAYLGRTLAACGGNMSEAARRLGLDRTHLYRKLRALALPR
jgi:two-component system, NtrC family, nitrogen regulation response regulator NtrX